MAIRPLLIVALFALTSHGVRAQSSFAACVGGSAAGFACSGVDLMSNLPLSTFLSPGSAAPSAGNDIWGWTDPQTGKEYALVGLTNGTAFVDISNPEAPIYLGKLPTATSSSTWRDIKVYANHAFIVSEASNHGMQVFDLTRLRGLSGPPQTFTADARYTGNGRAHNIAINEDTGFAYIVGATQSGFTCRAGGLHIVNIQNPATPVYAGCFDNDGYTHDTQCVLYQGPDPDYAGRELCFSSNEDTVTITDVTDKAAPVQVARVSYPSPSYMHQGWLTEDARFFVADDELDSSSSGTRTLVFDVEDLDNAEFAFAHFGAAPTRDHNQYVHGNYAYQSNYDGGLRILDLTGIASGSVSEVAFFDSEPSAQNPSGWEGQWSNYPFFESGIVIANDQNRGLFVLDPTGIVVAGAPGPVPASGFVLSAPVPNPTNSESVLVLTVGEAQQVRAVAYDALGRRVANVFDGTVTAGVATRLTFQAGSLQPGAYILRVEGESFSTTSRLTVTR
jgi:choice-of-anchor B domain-containing protein